MVHSLLKKFHVKDVISLRGERRVIQTKENESLDTREWNPFTYAVAESKNEVVKYCIHTSTQALGLPAKHLSYHEEQGKS